MGLTERKKARPEHRTSPFAHEAGHCLCGAWIIAVKENSRRRRIRAQYPKNKKKKISHTALGLCPCCNYIVTLLKPFCNRVL